MPSSVFPNFTTSGRPLSDWFPQPDQWSTNPDDIDPDTLPEGWTPEGAALMGGNVNRSPLEQLQFNTALQGQVQNANSQLQANKFFQNVAGLDTSTPEGISGVERFATAFPLAAANPAVQRYLQEARAARQLAFIGGRNAPLPPEGQRFLTRLYGLDPNDAAGWQQLQRDAEAHPDWIANPKVADDYRRAAQMRYEIANRASTKPNIYKGGELGIEARALENGIAPEEFPKDSQGNTDYRRLIFMTGERMRKNAESLLNAKGQQRQQLTQQQIDNRDAYLFKLAQGVESPPEGEAGDKLKKAWLERNIGTKPVYTPEEWDKAYKAQMPNWYNLRDRLQSLVNKGEVIPDELADRFGVMGPSPGRLSAGVTQQNTGANQMPPTQAAARPVPFESLGQRETREEKEKYGPPINNAWTDAKNKLDQQLRAAGFTGPELASLYKSIAAGERIYPAGHETVGIPAIQYALEKAGLPSNIEGQFGKNIESFQIPPSGPPIFGFIPRIPHYVSHEDLLQALAQEKVSNPVLVTSPEQRAKLPSGTIIRDVKGNTTVIP